MQTHLEADPTYKIVTKIGSIDLEYGVKGSELQQELEKAQAIFLRSMELRGLILYKALPENPVWLADERGEFVATYAIDWHGERRKVEKRGDGTEVLLPVKREESLEDSQGMVEYRIIGIFHAPETAIEILTHPGQRRDQERLAKNPTSFGAGGIQLPGTPGYYEGDVETCGKPYDQGKEE